MAETTTETPAPEAPEATQEQQQPAETPAPETPREDSPEEPERDVWDPERAREKIRKINSENRTLRERATKAEEKAASADELQQQKAALELQNLRMAVGYELGLPLNLATRLQGSNRDEMVADAETLIAFVAPAEKPAPTTGRPAPALKPGATPEVVTPPEDDSYPSHWLPQRQQ